LHRLERFSGEKTWFLCPLLNGYKNTARSGAVSLL
jgi:hypothetical protein